MPRVIHTGQALVDHVVEVPALPERGGNIMASRSQRYAGGAVNILVAAARSGAHVVHAGAHGTGPNGDLVREVMAREGIALATSSLSAQDTGVCVVLVEPGGERTFVTTLGAEREISSTSLGRSEPQPGDLVCVTGYSLVEPTRDPLLDWLDTVPDGCLLVLDPGAAFTGLEPSLQARVLSRTDIWTGNAGEARAAAGSLSPAAGAGPGELARAAAVVHGSIRPGGVVVVRDGERGCWVRAGHQTVAVQGYPQQPVDTNGAGDAHTGVLCAARVAGADWVTACRRANAAGAIKVTRRGPATAPTAAEVDAFLAQVPHPTR